MDCANLILFWLPFCSWSYGLFQKIQRSKYRGGAGGLGTTPKARDQQKDDHSNSSQLFRYSNELAHFVSSQIVHVSDNKQKGMDALLQQ